MAPVDSSFAVIERSREGNQVLVLLDTKVEAEAIACELRRRGLKVDVQQGPG